MTDGFESPAPKRLPRTNSRNWLAGRSSRREYWIWIAIILAISIALSFSPLKGTSGGMTAVLLFAQIRRLHDVGRTGWWAVAATFAPLIVMLPLMAVASLEVAALLGTVIELGLIVWIGVIPGDPAENRFGRTPPLTLSGFLTGR
jgi:uncharacterized membrane protein YhaH (DUF805 family)